MTRIIITGTNDMVRSLAEYYLAAQVDLEVLPSIEPTDNAAILEGEIDGTGPDVLVYTLLKPDTHHVRRVCQIAQEYPQLGVVLMGAHPHDGSLLELLRSGVRSFVPLDVPVEELLHAIRQAEQGQRYLPHPIYNKMIDTILSKIPTHPRSSDPNLNPEDRLTTREREVLQLAAEGRTCREIAQNLCVSPRTVETHRGNAMHKLGLSSRIELLRYAISRGLLRTD
jgi:DNA-binding NarL/FixJ family response regulator